MTTTSFDQVEFEKLVSKFTTIYVAIISDSTYLTDSKMVEQTYHILKTIQTFSAVNYCLEIFHAATFTLSKFEIRGTGYVVEEDSDSSLKNSIRHLFQQLGKVNVQPEVGESIRNSLENTKPSGLGVITNNSELLQRITCELSKSGIDLIRISLSNVKYQLLDRNIAFLLIDNRMVEAEALIKDIKTNHLLTETYIIGFGSDFDKQSYIRLMNAGLDMFLPPSSSLEIVLSRIKTIQLQRGKLTRKDELLTSLKKEWIRFQRFNSYFSLVLVHFQNEGNFHGEFLVGKLSKLLQTYQDGIRVYDEVHLWNTNSLMVLLPATSLEGAKFVAERIRQDTEMVGDHSKTMTIGVVESEHIYSNMFEMISRLEKAVTLNQGIRSICAIPLKEQTIFDHEGESRTKILIIDEDPIPPSILQNHFDPEKWDIQICLDGSTAIERAIEWRPEIIICETKMSNFDGFSFCFQVRQNPILQYASIVFLSSQSLNKHIIRGFKVGADDYIVKPFSAEEVGERIQRLIKIRR